MNLLVGGTLDYDRHCRLQFGAYAEVHDELAPSNEEKPRTIP